VEVPDYDLPEAAIAQTPAEPRDSARLLDGLDPAGAVHHRRIRDLPELVEPGDVVVVNDTRVMPARLRLAKSTGGAAEVLLLEPDGADPSGRSWTALVRPGRRLAPGTVLIDPAAGDPLVEVGDRMGADGRRRVRFVAEPAAVMDRRGELALPPYIHSGLSDPERYQTVYAARPGSVAAPTAGLHLTAEVMAALTGRGAAVHHLELQVGMGTFRPVTAEKVEDHVMHAERYSVPAETWEACRRARRVVAVGTTTVRALESVGLTGELSGTSDLFVRPGFPFSVVNVLLTNFHMPRSSLLLLLEAFAGPRWRDLYATALASGYRFLSFGDAMIVGRV
jgi:S-adenosylmethionine:tRNA ribosyltransferase-isomerase